MSDDECMMFGGFGLVGGVMSLAMFARFLNGLVLWERVVSLVVALVLGVASAVLLVGSLFRLI